MLTLVSRYGGFAKGEGSPVDGAYDKTQLFDGTISGTGNIQWNMTGTGGITNYYHAWLTKDLVGLKVYAEVKPTTISNGNNHIPIAVAPLDYASGDITYTPGDTGQPGASYRNNGTLFAVGGSYTYSSFTTNDIIGITFDGTTGDVGFYLNNSLLSGSTFSVRSWGSYTKWRFVSLLFDDFTNTAVTQIQTTQNYSTPVGYTWIGDIPY